MYHITEPLLFLFGKLEDVEGVVVVHGKTIIYHMTEPLLFLFCKLEDVEGVVVVHGNLGHVSPLLGVQAHDTRPQVPQHHKMYNYDQTKCLNPYNVNYQKNVELKLCGFKTMCKPSLYLL